jgi:hypothetical protein
MIFQKKEYLPAQIAAIFHERRLAGYTNFVPQKWLKEKFPEADPRLVQRILARMVLDGNLERYTSRAGIRYYRSRESITIFHRSKVLV